MSFGLKSAPSMFQYMMEIMGWMVQWQFDLLYLDGYVIFLRSVEISLNHLQTLAALLTRAKVSLKFNKCFSFDDHINYSGSRHTAWHTWYFNKRNWHDLHTTIPLEVSLLLSPSLALAMYFDVLFKSLHAWPYHWIASSKRPVFALLSALARLKSRRSKFYKIYCYHHR